MGSYFFLQTNKDISPPLLLGPGHLLHRCLLYVPVPDLVVAAVHRLLLGYCYGALLMAFNLTLNLVIDFLMAAHS